MFKKDFQKTDRIFWHDRLLDKYLLRFIPRNFYPNYFTFFRVVATPFVAFLMLTEQYYVGLIAFLLVSLTDAIDGSLARTRGQITEWGKIYDPIADKILVGTMIFIIVFRYLDAVTAYLIIGIEIIIVIIAWVRLKLGYKVQANIWGKIKMILQVLGVTILLLAVVFDLADLIHYANGSLYLAIAFAMVSLLTYGI